MFLLLLLSSLPAFGLEWKMSVTGVMSCPVGWRPIKASTMPCDIYSEPECSSAMKKCKDLAMQINGLESWSAEQDPAWDETRPSGCFYYNLDNKHHFRFNHKFHEGSLMLSQRVCERNPGKDKVYLDAAGTEMMDTIGAVRTHSTGYLNDYDKGLHWTAKPGQFLQGWHYVNFKKGVDDRIFDFNVAQNPAVGSTVAVTDGAWVNRFRDAFDYRCPDGSAIVELRSEHDNVQGDDRRWWIKCGRMSSTTGIIAPFEDSLYTWKKGNVEIKSGKYNTFTHGDHQDAKSHPWEWSQGWSNTNRVYLKDMNCPAGSVVCGMGGKYRPLVKNNEGDLNDDLGEDRAYRFQCCDVFLYDPGMCAVVQITVDDFKLHTPDTPDKVVVDALNGQSCGSGSDVKYTVSKGRTSEREWEEVFETSETLSETFSHSVSETIGVTFKTGATKDTEWGIEVSASQSWEDTQSSTTTRSSRTMKKEIATFSQGYEYVAPAGSKIELKAMTTEYKTRLFWWGIAQCFSKDGNLLESQKLSGTWDNVFVSEATIVLDQRSCEEDGWTVNDRTYCDEGDWMKDASSKKYLYASSKREALDLCQGKNDCQCVMDRGCGNLDTRGQTYDGNFVLCKRGCEARLRPSDYSCTLTYNEPTCKCKHSGGGPLAAEVVCEDGTEYKCGTGQICEDGKDYAVQLSSPRAEECPGGFHQIAAEKMPCFSGDQACIEAATRCEAAALELKLDFSGEAIDEDFREFVPMGCHQWIDGTIRFNAGSPGKYAGRREHRLVCSRSNLAKVEWCKKGETCDASKLPMCKASTMIDGRPSCFKSGVSFEAEVIAPAKKSWTKWGPNEPDNKDFDGTKGGKDEDCVALDSKNGQWLDLPCDRNIRPTQKTICQVKPDENGEFEFGSKFREVGDVVARSRDEAKAICKKTDAILPYVEDKADNEYLMKLTKGEMIWLGLNDIAEEGKMLFDQHSPKFKASETNFSPYKCDNQHFDNQVITAGMISKEFKKVGDARRLCSSKPGSSTERKNWLKGQDCDWLVCAKEAAGHVCRPHTHTADTKFVGNNKYYAMKLKDCGYCGWRKYEGRFSNANAEGKVNGVIPSYPLEEAKQKCIEHGECRSLNCFGAGHSTAANKCELRKSAAAFELGVSPGETTWIFHECNVNRWREIKGKSAPGKVAGSVETNLAGAQKLCSEKKECKAVTCRLVGGKVDLNGSSCTLRTGDSLVDTANEVTYLWSDDEEKAKDYVKYMNGRSKPLKEGYCVRMHPSLGLETDQQWQVIRCDEVPNQSHMNIGCGSDGNYVSIPPAVRRTWNDARALCHSLGLPLAIIRSKADMKALEESNPKNKLAWFIGLSDKTGLGGEWTWDSKVVEPEYTNWAKGQPDNKQGDLNCAVIRGRQDLANVGKWFDVPCNSKFTGHVLCGSGGHYVRAPKKTTSNRDEARAYCQSIGLPLVTATTDMELLAAVGAAKGEQVWLGLSRAPGKDWHLASWDHVDASRTYGDKVATPARCQTVCKLDHTCKYYTWNSEAKSCELMAKVKSTDGKGVANRVSGEETCPSEAKCKDGKTKMCGSYVVQSADTFYKISLKYPGVNYNQICACNGIVWDKHSLKLGEVLQIPCAARRRLSIEERLSPGELKAPKND